MRKTSVSDSSNIFHEIYGVYFKTTAKIIKHIIDCRNNDKTNVRLEDILKIINETAFKESLGETSPSSNLLASAIDCNKYVGVVDAVIKNKEVIYETSLKCRPKMPLTYLEKQWLKTIRNDPRVRLFDCDFPDLKDVEPLYDPQDIYYCGQYDLGDDYDSEKYISIFKTIFTAIKEKRFLYLEYESLHEGLIETIVEPQRLQYSIKEDRFRFFALKDGRLRTYNISRIIFCKLGTKIKEISSQQYPEASFIEVILNNERNTFERFMLYFSNYERRASKIGNGVFKIKMFYPKQDETEVLVNILSFTPMTKVIAPEEMKEQFLERIRKQRELLEIDITKEKK